MEDTIYINFERKLMTVPRETLGLTIPAELRTEAPYPEVKEVGVEPELRVIHMVFDSQGAGLVRELRVMLARN